MQAKMKLHKIKRAVQCKRDNQLMSLICTAGCLVLAAAK